MSDITLAFSVCLTIFRELRTYKNDSTDVQVPPMCDFHIRFNEFWLFRLKFTSVFTQFVTSANKSEPNQSASQGEAWWKLQNCTCAATPWPRTDPHEADAIYHDYCRIKFMSPQSVSSSSRMKQGDDIVPTINEIKTMMIDTSRIWNWSHIYYIYIENGGTSMSKMMLISKLCEIINWVRSFGVERTRWGFLVVEPQSFFA